MKGKDRYGGMVVVVVRGVEGMRCGIMVVLVVRVLGWRGRGVMWSSVVR